MDKRKIYIIWYLIALLAFVIFFIFAIMLKDRKGVLPMILLLLFGTWGVVYLLRNVR